MNNNESAYTMNANVNGHVRIWEYCPEHGFGRLLFDRPNKITREGSSIAARALAGQQSAGITHMYVGYDSNHAQTETVGDSIASFGPHIALPLAYSPGFGATDSNYASNIVYFTAYLTGFDAGRVSSLANGDTIYSLGLVNRTYLINGQGSQDSLFSRKVVLPSVTYNHSLAITWGITFTSI